MGTGAGDPMNTEGMALPNGGEKLPPPVTRGIPRGARRVVILSLLLLVPGFAAVWLLIGPSTAVGLVAGGVMSVANLWVLSRLVVKATGDGDDVHWLSLTGQLLFKVGLRGACLWVLIVPLSIDVFGLLLGLSIVLVGSVLSQIVDVLV